MIISGMQHLLNKIEFTNRSSKLRALFCGALVLLAGCAQKKTLSEQEVSLLYFRSVGTCDLEQIKKIREQYKLPVDHQNIDHVNGLMLSSFKGNTECVNYFIENGSDLNAKDVNFRGALFYSIEGKKPAVSLALIDKGFEFRELDNFNLSPLMVAAKLGQIEVVTRLIQKGVNINQTDENGWSALYFAVSAKNKDVVKLLVESGADLNTKDSDGKSPRDLAYEDLSFDISDYLENIQAPSKSDKIKKSKTRKK